MTEIVDADLMAEGHEWMALKCPTSADVLVIAVGESAAERGCRAVALVGF